MSKKLSVVQAFRGIAACLVAVFHVSHSIFSIPKYWPDRPFGCIFEFGHSGVEFFFVLSGFIIYLVHRRDIGQPSRARAFAWKRISRVYPAYWVILLLVIPVFYFFSDTGSGFEKLPAVWFDSVLLFHVFHKGGQVMSVTWTLFHEVMFYMLFALLILNRRMGSVALTAWMLGSCAAYIWGAGMSEMARYYFDPLHLLFAMGMLSAWIITKGRVVAPASLSAVGLVIFTATAVAETYSGFSPTMSIFYGIGSSCLLVGTVGLEQGGWLRAPRFLMFLGDASYSIYLVHIIALSILAKLAFAWFGPSPEHPLLHATLFAAMSFAAIGAGIVYHLLVEAPLLNWVSRRPKAELEVAAVGD